MTLLAGAGTLTVLLLRSRPASSHRRPGRQAARAQLGLRRGDIFSYLGNSVPAVLGGIAVTALGLRTATVIYAPAIVVIILSAFALRLNQVRTQRRTPVAPSC